ncbi:MAG: rhomboid family intramembrane serine protease [Pygmaiobacter massiliensis]|nr:rhomboid family intramembrane serine protease [Pygmaiobacter massiliensis]
MSWLDRLERKYGNLGIPNLMTTVVAGMALVFVCDLLFPRAQLTSYLYFSPTAILHGQVWRVITFIFLPPDSSLLFMVFALYLYYFIGTSLEREWGSFRFTVYYLVGILGNILAGFVTGGATNSFLNLSLFFAFAAVYPNMQLLLFFLIPIKIKYLAIFDGVIYAYAFLVGNLSVKAAIVASLANFLLFFGPGVISRIQANIRYSRQRQAWRDANRRDRW